MRKTFLLILLSTFLFSSMEIMLKLAGSSFNAIQLNFLRFLIGGIFLLPLAIHSIIKKKLKIDRRAIGSFALTGLICVLISMTLFQLAVMYGKASIAAVVFSSNPVFALLFSYLILHETLSRPNLISVVISVLGLLIIMNPFHLTNPLGMILALLSAVTFGFYSIISRKVSQTEHFDGVTITSFTFIFGSLELAVLMALSHLPMVAEVLNQNPLTANFAMIPYFAGINLNTIAMILYLGIGVTGIGFATYFIAMERSDVATASLVFFIKPVLAPIMALIILHEAILLNTWIGIGVIVVGSVVSFVGQRAVTAENTMVHEDYLETIEDEGERADQAIATEVADVKSELDRKEAAVKNKSLSKSINEIDD
ncbi:DMT family transporter [Lapidilactobacillus mulanensis]|nr:DMT family transporter [Lapidilactobacillus mulanensis]